MPKLLCGFYALGTELRKLESSGSLPKSRLLDPSGSVQACHWSETWCGTLSPNERRTVTFFINQTTRVEGIHAFGGCAILTVRAKGKTYPTEENEQPKPFLLPHVTLEVGMIVDVTLVGATFMTGSIDDNEKE